jgi:hypothetical protein
MVPRAGLEVLAKREFDVHADNVTPAAQPVDRLFAEQSYCEAKNTVYN